MQYEIIKLSQIHVCFFQTRLTGSHSQNYSIIRRNWEEFNSLLRINKSKPGVNWVKYAITRKYKDHYYYQCAIPSESPINNFESTIIPAGNYLKFIHKGPMPMFSKTINKIYKNIIPDSQLEIDYKRSLIHFERYDSKFNWNNKDSIIELFVPLKSSL